MPLIAQFRIPIKVNLDMNNGHFCTVNIITPSTTKLKFFWDRASKNIHIHSAWLPHHIDYVTIAFVFCQIECVVVSFVRNVNRLVA